MDLSDQFVALTALLRAKGSVNIQVRLGGRQSRSGHSEKRKISCLYHKSNHNSSAVQPASQSKCVAQVGNRITIPSLYNTWSIH